MLFMRQMITGGPSSIREPAAPAAAAARRRLRAE
jgi:hypothetical protein